MMFDSSTGQAEELKNLPKIQERLNNELSIILANSDMVYGDIAAYKNKCLLKTLMEQYTHMEKNTIDNLCSI